MSPLLKKVFLKLKLLTALISKNAGGKTTESNTQFFNSILSLKNLEYCMKIKELTQQFW